MKLFKSLIAAVTLTIIVGYLHAQPFSEEIAAFKHQDSVSAAPQKAILFVGSSSFRMWKDVGTYFPGRTIINRGFGGSSLPDVIRYEEDIIFPYHPAQIVIYCGENDVAASDTVTAELVFQRFRRLFTDIRKKLPDVSLVFVSIKPSPSRWQWKDRMIKANELIRNFLKSKKHTAFVSVWKSMLGPDGKPMPDIFLEDNLHMNAKGYAIWKKLLEPYLIKP